MTKVRFTFVDVQGNPLPLMEFKLIVRRASFNDEEVGVTLPEQLTVVTDATGQVIVDLWPLKTAYRIQIAEEYEELCGKLNWAFYVPHTDQIVEAQSLFLVPAPNNIPWDEEAIGKITQAVIDSHDSAVAADASADRAELAALTIEGDAARAEAAATAAEGSKVAAAASAQNAADNNTWAGQSATAANVSKNAAAISATEALSSKNASAVSASDALASKNAAAGSATTATQQATLATSAKTSAETAAGTATTKAGEAMTSANNASASASTATTQAGISTTQAGIAKTEADRATAATDSKQDKSAPLTALSGATWTANSYPIFAANGSVYVETITDEARLLLRQNNAADMRVRLVAAKAGANSDITSLTGITTPLSVPQGGTGVTTLPVPFTRLRDSQALTYAEAAAERLRMKTFEPINFVVDIDDTTATQVRGPGYVTVSTLGTKPPGASYGILTTVIITGDVLSQTLEPLSGLAGVTFPLYRRSGYGSAGGKWGPWRMVIDSDTALSDPASGGILRRTVINGIALTKYADGRNIANGVFQPTSVSVPINSTQSVAIALPFSIGTDDLFSSANINVQPSITYDHYGVVSAFITANGTTLNVVIRNGATEQTFSIRGILMGHWK